MMALTVGGTAILLAAGAGVAEITIETVPVGNPGNAGELSGQGAGGWGPDRICGAVDYGFNIGKYEVTAGQYTEFLNAVGGVDTYRLYDPSMQFNSYGCKIERYDGSGTLGDPYQYRVAGDWANRPVNYVSWGDAARFANWLHNGQPTEAQDLTTTEDGAYYLNGATSNADLVPVSRESDWKWAITSEDEWYKAAHYDPATSTYFAYPTSSDTPPGYVNDSGNLSTTGNPFVEGGPDPGNYATHDGDAGRDGIGSPYYRTVVGEWESSDSPYGTFDQGGNVWELNEAILYGSSRGVRGGAFSDSDYDFLRASVRIVSIPPTGEDYYFGFRVSQVPEPATLGLLALSGLVLIRRRRG
jgi:formylglycine-generating enzyme required for sulfatase activity